MDSFSISPMVAAQQVMQLASFGGFGVVALVVVFHGSVCASLLLFIWT